MYKVTRSPFFKKDVKHCQKKRRDMAKFKALDQLLIKGERLPRKYRDHALSGNWQGHRECHIEPNWLLIYKIDEEAKEIEYVRMGTHDKLFK